MLDPRLCKRDRFFWYGVNLALSAYFSPDDISNDLPQKIDYAIRRAGGEARSKAYWRNLREKVNQILYWGLLVQDRQYIYEPLLPHIDALGDRLKEEQARLEKAALEQSA